MSPLIEAHDLRVVRGRRALLDGVSIAARAGEVLAVVGPNGAGKSTLLEALGGAGDAAQGEVVIGGVSLSELPVRARAQRVAFLRQHHALPFPMSALEVALLGRSPYHHGIERPRDFDVALEALSATDTARLAARRMPTLSGGEAQRVHFARVLAQLWGDAAGPERATDKVLLLDEPTAGVDLGRAARLLATFRAQAAMGAAVIVVLHDLNEAMRAADRVAVLSAGRLVAEGSPAVQLTPTRIREVFGADVARITDPETGAPVIVPRAARAKPPWPTPEPPPGG